MPKTLASNGLPGSNWMGSDEHLIRYPSVETCITITCRMNTCIFGAHLFYGLPDHQMREDLQSFRQAMGINIIQDMFIIGNLNAWINPKLFRREMTYNIGNGGVLFRNIKNILNYNQVIKTHQLENQDVKATRNSTEVHLFDNQNQITVFNNL